MATAMDVCDGMLQQSHQRLQEIMLRAAAQAICDSGGAMGAGAEVVEQALAAQLKASGSTGVEDVSLLSGGLPETTGRGGFCIGEAGAGPMWTLCVGSAHQDGGASNAGQQAHHILPGALVPNATCLSAPKRRRTNVP
eukprot:gb/GFBE01065614.1/.p1 GENE.gb/GFBE01065614.1/~~gb/GFBE01065614.1/.p1  ORF type:complete len:138 (+),score=23.67 gb/GFBE01065614.1/:1-414(+)